MPRGSDGKAGRKGQDGPPRAAAAAGIGATAAGRRRRLSSGAEAVMIWARGEAPAGGGAARYMELLSGECGKGGGAARIVAECERVWPHYGEVIRNRKSCIRRLAVRALRAGRIRQAVILGAGMDPLSVEIAEATGHSVVSYEIDSSPARRKHRMIREASAAAAGCVRHVAADLEEAGPAGVSSALEQEGWDPGSPSLVVAEGVSYYLRKPTLRGLLGPLRAGGGGEGLAIVEYLRDAASIEPGRALIADAVFGVFARGTGIGGLSRYSDEEAAGLVAGRGEEGSPAGEAPRIVGPAEMERMRTGRNRLFPDDASGWISICHGRL